MIPNPFWQPAPAGSPNPVPSGSNSGVETPWAPYTGPRNEFDGVPAGGGKTLPSGAPEIVLNPQPVKNQYNYTGPAARNPYFTTPGNPLRPGYVLGFDRWFEENWVIGGNKTMPAPVNKINSATEEGGKEALRLIQQHQPDAKLVNSSWNATAGPFTTVKPTWEVELPGGARINAGSVINTYYNQGWGVTIASDQYLESNFRVVS